MERDKLKKEVSKKPSGIFFIDGNRAFFFEQSLSAPIPLELTPDIVSNLEVINKKKLDLLIHSFIKNNKLQPTNIVILLSTRMTFDKDFPHGSIEIDKNIEEFLELVPFEETISKKAVFSGRSKVSAANRELCDAIRTSFLSAGFNVSGVYSVYLCLEVIPELSSNMDLNLVVNKLPMLKDFNMQPVVEYSSNTQEKEKPNKTRMILLVGVFVFLILILAFVFYRNILAPAPPALNVLPTPVITPIQNIPAPVTEVTPEVSTESAENIPTEIPEVTPVISQ